MYLLTYLKVPTLNPHLPGQVREQRTFNSACPLTKADQILAGCYVPYRSINEHLVEATLEKLDGM